MLAFQTVLPGGWLTMEFGLYLNILDMLARNTFALYMSILCVCVCVFVCAYFLFCRVDAVMLSKY